MEDQRQLDRKLQRLQHMLVLYRLLLATAVVVIVVLTVLLFFAKAPRFGRAILIDGQVVAMVRNEKAAITVRERLLAQGAGREGGEVTFRQKWEDLSRPADGAQVLSVNQAVRQLTPKVTVVREAYAIESNGVRLVIVPSRESAQRVLDKLKSRYGSPADAVVRSTSLRPAPAIRPCTAPPSEIISDEVQAVARLTGARASVEPYRVRAGDYPERIAARKDMTLEEFWRLNSDLRGKNLRVGQSVTVLGPRAGLVVVTVKETVSTEKIAAPVVKEKSTSLPKGQKKTVDPGKPGLKRVRWEVTTNNEREVSRRAVSEEILRDAQPQRVRIGTGVTGG